MSSEYYQGVVLHARVYKETSLLLTLWLKGIGKVSGVIKGARSKKKPNLCQPFSLLNIKVKLAKSDDALSIIHQVDQEKSFVSGTYLSQLSRLYINELLYWLLPHDHCDQALFDHYILTIERLIDDEIDRNLRHFELQLLNSLGYSFQCDLDSHNNPIKPECFYSMKPLSAFYLIDSDQGIKGETIFKINADVSAWHQKEMKVIQRLIKTNLAACLGGRQLQTRLLLYHYLAGGGG
ncbi:DNA repair protein RecO [Facilibium subflavum]|uniref:DNA repair protein RecO n=1 Tax=Facilibium subflavum TaxID=2219058 RepID=UPI000E654BB0|nr:DNA repair protein RecO [Facilibium subflavum]